MEIQRLSGATTLRDPARGHIARMIEVVGTPKFEAELFSFARSAANCEHLTAYTVPKHARPRVLLAANTGTTPIARPTAQRYLERYSHLDPVNRAANVSGADQGIAMRIVPENDIENDLYRHDCYTAVKMMDRLTILRQDGSEGYRIHFYTGARYGRFAASDIENIMSSADLLLSLVRKHDTTEMSAGNRQSPEFFSARLRLVAPGMPDRELQVCTAIMLGMTSEAIALKLGISVNTVLTYRKRAYGRLNISCQNELMRLILT
jgi:DNA-binding CsgD family transcriptional regulator